jgi:hypothetical protein
LLEGLEISIVNKNEIFKTEKLRFNSEFYLKKIVEFRKKGGKKLGAFLSYNKRGIQPIYSNNGIIRALRSVNIREMGISEERAVYVEDAFYNANKRGTVNNGDVLLTSTGVGTLGRACLLLDTEKYFVDGHITILRTKEIRNTFLFLFLNSSYGQLQINALYNGSSGQIEIYPDDINEILLPTLSASFQKRLDELVIDSIQKMSYSNVKYTEAESILLRALNWEFFSPTSYTVNIKSFKESFLDSGRLDAEYYQPKFDELEARLYETGSAILLGSDLSINKRGSQPKYTEEPSGILVLNSKHIRENRIEFIENRLGELVEAEQLIIRKNDVLINGTGVGTIGRSAVYLRNEPALPDNHVTILRTKELDPVFLSVQLNSIIGKLQVDKYFKGSSGQIELYPADINKFVIWKAPYEVQQQVRAAIELADSLKCESELILKLAKDALEIAIERGESQAVAFINQNTK